MIAIIVSNLKNTCPSLKHVHYIATEALKEQKTSLIQVFSHFYLFFIVFLPHKCGLEYVDVHKKTKTKNPLWFLRENKTIKATIASIGLKMHLVLQPNDHTMVACNDTSVLIQIRAQNQLITKPPP